MRTRLAPVLLLAGCASVAAAEASPFRDALAAGGGCGRHRALAAERLGPLDGAPLTAAEPEVDLFGKEAGAWSEAEIRDARAVFAACEARVSGARADPELSRRFEAALRRAVALARAREPAAESAEASPPAGAGGGARTGVSPAGRGLRQGPAFIPAKAGASPPRDPGQQAAEVFRDAEQIERAGHPVSIPAATQPAALSSPPEAVSAGAGTGVERGARRALSAAFGAPRNAALAGETGEPKPAEPRCVVSLRSFELLQSDMRMPEVESLLGCRGASDGTATIPGLGAFETYSWTDRGGTFTVTLVFQGQRLKSKAQRGLAN